MASELLLKRVEELTTKFLDQYNYVDLHALGVFYKKSTDSQEISVYKDDALINTVKMWMLSRKGDYYREPLRGGIIDFILGSKMNLDSSNAIRDKILTQFKTDFSLVEIVQLTIEMDTNNKVWKIAYNVIDIINKKLVNFSVNVQV